MDPVIEVAELSKSYRKLQALSDISFQVSRGQIFGIIGPDGAGKSTLMHIVTGVLSAPQGKVTVLGRNILRDPESIKESIALMPQGLGLSLAADLSVEENINFFAEINKIDKKTREQRKDKLLKSTRLDAFLKRPAKNLSGGMKQKLALCCTLIHEPQLIFLDEPTTGVDPISRQDIWTIINTMLKEKNITVFMSTSYMDEAARCHEVLLMHKGKIINRGRPDELSAKLKDNFAQIEAKSQEETLKALKKQPKISVVYPLGGRLNVIFEEGGLAELKRQAGNLGVGPGDIKRAIPGIEDVFLSEMSKERADVDENVFDELFKGEGQNEKSAKTGLAATELMIKADSLEKKFGSFTAVNKINFSVKSGEIFGFLGPNGAGKTTTIKMFCGLYAPTSGFGMIGGLDLSKNQFEVKKSIGYMSQKFSLYRDMTVSENIDLYGGIYGVPKRELRRRRNLILKIADLSGQEDSITGSLPMGIKQRLALGCAIIHKPRCIFLDEPTSGVDPIARMKFWEIIFLLSRKMGITVLVTTHYMDEAEHCDRLSLMTKGNLVAMGAPDQLKTRVTDEIGILLEVSTSDPFASSDILREYFTYCSIYGTRVHIYTKNADEDENKVKELLAKNNITLQDIRKAVIPFEDVFVYFCEQKKGV